MMIATKEHGVRAGSEINRHRACRFGGEHLHARCGAVEIESAGKAGIAGGKPVVAQKSVAGCDDECVTGSVAGKGCRPPCKRSDKSWGDPALQMFDDRAGGNSC